MLSENALSLFLKANSLYYRAFLLNSNAKVHFLDFAVSRRTIRRSSGSAHARYMSYFVDIVP